jgi:rSAM/selenodomain-associated transferase 2
VSISVVVPTRRCDERVLEHLQDTRRKLPDAQLIVVEPDPDPDPEREQQSAPGHALDAARAAQLSAIGATLTSAPRGRGFQCNAGARIANGEVLLFLHDDTRLPDAAAALIDTVFGREHTQVACFRLTFDAPHPLLRIYAACSALDSYLTSFGDQGILIRRTLFDRLGGFPDWPLFEDVELLRRARRRARIRKLPARVVTSAVRFVEGGMVRQQLLNAELMLRFALGADPESLRVRYEHARAGRDTNRH